MNKFKVGDKIRRLISNSDSNNRCLKGDILTISEILNSGEFLCKETNGLLHCKQFVEKFPAEFEFQKGDIVEAFGLRGVVTYTDTITNDISVEVKTEYDNITRYLLFTKDGKAEKFHKTPSLKLISRPKAVKKVTMYPVLVQPESDIPFISDELFVTLAKGQEAYPRATDLITSMGVEVTVEDN